MKTYLFIALNREFNLTNVAASVEVEEENMELVFAGFQLAQLPTTYVEAYEVTSKGNKLVKTTMDANTKANQIIKLASEDTPFSQAVESAIEPQLQELYGVSDWCDLDDKVAKEFFNLDANGFYIREDEESAEERFQEYARTAIKRYYEENPTEDLYMNLWSNC
jgi:hypothetical protein